MTEEPETKNITNQVETKATDDNPKSTENTDSTQPNPHEGEDHPYMAVVDIAIDQSITYCRDHDIPEPNTAAWEGFCRPCFNRALWHYCPDSIEPEQPVLNLIIGLCGLALCFAPPILYLLKEKLETTDSTQSDAPTEDSTPQTEEKQDEETTEPLTYELPEKDLPATRPKRVAIGGEE
ncbi:MAG: hypothetical protein O0X93_08380 [Methanocorpusculum sp.]|nr:hypothetical protein [Methanocorpusculum sp.]MDE2523154.1 hypothetical protein [Methanocorpusculum sp.]MDE2525018.1 hypothetical protein [Methanocorpusculum sp.]